MSRPDKTSLCLTIITFVLPLVLSIICSVPPVILPTLAASSSIDINKATLEQLDELSGIGPKYAQAIIDARPFSLLDDLIKVKGIGEKTLEKIKSQGLACVVCPSPATTTASTTPSGGPLPRPQAEAEVGPEAEGSITPTQTESAGGATTYPANIFINEIMPSPAGPDAENEWLEIYNNNNFSVNLTGWQIKDREGATKTYTLKNATIKPQGFLVIKRSESKITLQNTGDGIVLLNPNSKTADKTEFGKATQGQSWAKTTSGWQWTTTPTPNSQNLISQPMPEVSPRAFATATATTSFTANILQTMPKKSKNLIYIIIALIIALSSGAFVIYLKHKTENL